MPNASSLRPVGLLILALVTLALVRWLVARPVPMLYAQTSPLATPWPTLVVTYHPVLPTVTPLLAPTATAVRANFIFHSPLPTPTPIPDFTPPQTTLQITGEQTTTGWYRSPVSVTFAITDNFGAGVTAYQLDNAPTWTDREYYYPPVVITDDGVHTLAYESIDRLHNTEAPQTAQIRIDRTPPQVAAPEVDGNQLLNGWYNTPVQVTFTGSDALSGLAGFAEQATNAVWVDSPAVTTLSTTGQHILTWRAVDKAGNVSAVQQTTVQVDLTPPTTTYTLDALPVNGWYTRPVTVTLSAVDLGAGVFQTQYRVNGEPGWRSYGEPFPVNQAGTQIIIYESTDRALNTETPHTLTLPLDLAAPTLDISVSHPPATGNWYSGLITVTAQASDAQSGVATIEAQLDNAAWQSYTAPLPFTTGVLHAVRFRATDQVGHVATSALLSLGVDTQPPTTTVQLSPLPNAAGWFGTPVTVTLASTDTQTGVLQTKYRLNNAAWQPYTQSFVVNQEGTQTLTYYATDQALNAETVHTLTLPIDLAAPLLTASVSPTQTSHGWYRQAVSVTLQAQDVTAGLGTVQVALDGAGWQPYTNPLTVRPGAAHTVRFRALDRAGHTASTNLLTLGVDGQPPTTTLLLSQAPNAAGWLNQPVTLTLVATDTETGVFQTQYQWQNQPSPAIYQQPLRLTQAGQTTLTWFSLDRALNQESPHTRTLQLDLTPPTVAYAVTGQSVAPGWYQTAATVNVTATDALAGVAQVEYRLDNGDWQPYTAPLTVANGGQHAVQLRARDAADNVSAVNSARFGLDTLPPVSTAWLDGGRGPNGWYVTPVTVTLTTTDTGAGVASLRWRLNGGLWQNYTGPFGVTTERVNLLEYAAVDKAGNQEAQKFTVFSLDLKNPASQAVVVHGLSGNNGWYISPVSLTLNGQDQESGLSGVAYQLDQQSWQTATTPVELYTEGIHRVTYHALDASGRLEATRTLTVSIDLTPPQIQTNLPTELTYGNLTLTGLYTVTDAMSRVLTTTVLLNGQPYQTRQPLRLGENTVEISAVNGAGLAAKRVQSVLVTGGKLYLPMIRQAR